MKNKKSKKSKKSKVVLSKKEKELKKIRKVVKREFFSKLNGRSDFDNGKYRYTPFSDTEKNALIDAIAKGVKLNKTLLERDNENRKVWKQEYHQVLFEEFKKLVNDYNESLSIKATELEDKIEKYTRQIEQLKEERKFQKSLNDANNQKVPF